jgi:hypothetical protein
MTWNFRIVIYTDLAVIVKSGKPRTGKGIDGRHVFRASQPQDFLQRNIFMLQLGTRRDSGRDKIFNKLTNYVSDFFSEGTPVCVLADAQGMWLKLFAVSPSFLGFPD